MWTGCGRQGVLAAWDVETFEKIHEKQVECRGISRLAEVNNKVRNVCYIKALTNIFKHCENLFDKFMLVHIILLNG